jgi:hypothetical protein
MNFWFLEINNPSQLPDFETLIIVARQAGVDQTCCIQFTDLF